jgi:hypothetical protein
VLRAGSGVAEEGPKGFATWEDFAVHKITEADGRELVAGTTSVSENAWKGREWRDRR